jgi:uncharacterized metal-binding protein
MADQTSCSCGDTSAQENGTKRIIIPCAGIANVGQLTNLAALQLTAEGYGVATCVALLGTGAKGLKKKIQEADEVVFIDGCPTACGRTIAAAQGVTPDQYIVITTLGIKKAGSIEFSDDDLETVVSAAWEGTGRTEKNAYSD